MWITKRSLLATIGMLFVIIQASNVDCVTQPTPADKDIVKVDDSEFKSNHFEDRMGLLFFSSPSSRMFPNTLEYPRSWKKNDCVMDKQTVAEKQIPGCRPKICNECSNEWEARKNLYPLTTEQVYGHDLFTDQNTVDVPMISSLVLGKLDIAQIGHLELSEITECEEMTFPQLLSLLETGKIVYMHDTCVSTIQPGLFNLLTPYLVEKIYEEKAWYLIANWRYYDPLVLVQTPAVREHILKVPRRSYLCCTFEPNDFGHVNNLNDASDECLAAIFSGEKCKNIQPSFFNPGNFPEIRLKFEESKMKHLDSAMEGVPLLKVTPPETVSSRIFNSTRTRALTLMNEECFDNLPDETKAYTWLKYKDTELNRRIVTQKRCRDVERIINQVPEMIEDLGINNIKHDDSDYEPYNGSILRTVLIVLGIIALIWAAVCIYYKIAV